MMLPSGHPSHVPAEDGEQEVVALQTPGRKVYFVSASVELHQASCRADRLNEATGLWRLEIFINDGQKASDIQTIVRSLQPRELADPLLKRA